jgi:outer membrane protein assembly factor BamB
MMNRRSQTTAAIAAGMVLAACGSAPADRSPSATTRRPVRAGSTDGRASALRPPTVGPSAGRVSSARLLDWPEFGLDPQRSNASASSTGITAVNVARLHHVTVALAGTVDSSPVYIHGTSVAGASRDVTVVTTTYGRTVAIDAESGRILWTFTPAGYSKWAGGAQITTTSPLVDPDRRSVYAASPDGLIHKLALADGSEVLSGGWPVKVTRDAGHEKLAAALNVDGRELLAATGGYLGDAPPYQGHVVAIDRASGRIASVFNTLCANRRHLIAPQAAPPATRPSSRGAARSSRRAGGGSCSTRATARGTGGPTSGTA